MNWATAMPRSIETHHSRIRSWPGHLPNLGDPILRLTRLRSRHNQVAIWPKKPSPRVRFKRAAEGIDNQTSSGEGASSASSHARRLRAQSGYTTPDGLEAGGKTDCVAMRAARYCEE